MTGVPIDGTNGDVCPYPHMVPPPRGIFLANMGSARKWVLSLKRHLLRREETLVQI